VVRYKSTLPTTFRTHEREFTIPWKVAKIGEAEFAELHYDGVDWGFSPSAAPFAAHRAKRVRLAFALDVLPAAGEHRDVQSFDGNRLAGHDHFVLPGCECLGVLAG